MIKYDECTLEAILDEDRKVKDSYDMWVEHESERARMLARRPKCAECGEPIQEDVAYRINGKLICEKCIKDYEVFVDDEE